MRVPAPFSLVSGDGSTTESFGISEGVCHDLVVAHPTRPDWPALTKKWRRTTEEGFHLNGTGPAARLSWTLRALVVLASGPVHLPKLMVSPKLDTPGERLRGAATLLRLRARRFTWMLRQAATGHL